ncbi:MAG: lytic transglycosylase domain-containing protein [Nitrospirae bacterium]|nr:lytic transglycosylase domain-containing protein [Nitrospirota bacterium]
MPALTGSSLLHPSLTLEKTPDVGGVGNSATRKSNNPQSRQTFEGIQANNTYKLVPGGTAAPSKPEVQDDNKPQDWWRGAEAPKASPKASKLDKYDRYINESASAYGLDPALIKAVIVAESGGNANARSRSGARGLMQLMPATAAELGVSNSYDPKQNINGGSRYLRQLLDRYNGDLRQALAAYNWGMGNLERKPGKMPQVTKNYIAKVEGYYKGYSEDPTLA